MPTYEYLCRQCGHRFEAWQHMTDEPLKVCPKCGAEIHRVLYPAGIVFKGSGFYKTEYGGSSSGEKSSSTESKTAASEGKGSTESSKSDGASSSKSESAGSGSSKSENTGSSASCRCWLWL
jgi:putative FmdB family regulatory protein